MKRQSMTTSTLYCDTCEHPFTIARKVSHQREPGHIKHMYCPHCKQTQRFIETDDRDKTLSFWDDWHNTHSHKEATPQ